jgi:hypothetical protein
MNGLTNEAPRPLIRPFERDERAGVEYKRSMTRFAQP